MRSYRIVSLFPPKIEALYFFACVGSDFVCWCVGCWFWCVYLFLGESVLNWYGSWQDCNHYHHNLTLLCSQETMVQLMARDRHGGRSISGRSLIILEVLLYRSCGQVTLLFLTLLYVILLSGRYILMTVKMWQSGMSQFWRLYMKLQTLMA